MEEIRLIIETYKEDHPEVYITDSMIQAVIEDNIELIIEEIRKSL